MLAGGWAGFLLTLSRKQHKQQENPTEQRTMWSCQHWRDQTGKNWPFEMVPFKKSGYIKGPETRGIPRATSYRWSYNPSKWPSAAL